MAQSQHDPARALIAAATQRGVISDAQRDQLSELLAEMEGARLRRVDAPRGISAVTMAYATGTMLAVAGAVWFLVEWWLPLGPWGVLGVGAAYTVALLAGSRWLDTHGFARAANLVLLLAVVLTPVLAWSLESIAGLWPAGAQSNWLDEADRWMCVCWAVIDLATMLAALLAFRWRPDVVFTAPLAVMLWGLCVHVSRVAAGEYLVGSLARWLMLAIGLFVCAVAGEIDRRGQRPGADYAFCFWQVGLFTSLVMYLAIWLRAGEWRHLMPVVSLAMFALAILLRRRTHLTYGLLGLFGYLAYLVLDVFRQYVSPPVVITALGLLVIVATVWLQHKFKHAISEMDTGTATRTLPPMVTRAPFILAFSIAMLSIADVKEEMQQRVFVAHLRILQQHSGSAHGVSRPAIHS